LKLYRLLKRQGIGIKDVKWLVHVINIGAYKISKFKNSMKIKVELEAIDYKKAKYELENMNNQIRDRAQIMESNRSTKGHPR
jgi:hypothetical protein